LHIGIVPVYNIDMQETTTIKRRPRLRDEVREKILDMIRGGKMRPGDRLLSEKKLGQSFKVNHLTIRAALSDLENHGVVERRPGSGTFLKDSIYSGTDSAKPKRIDHSFAVIVLRDEEHFFSKLRNAIIHELEKDGYFCLSSSLSESGHILVQQIIKFQDKGVRTLIIDQNELKHQEIVDFLNSDACKFDHVIRILGNGFVTEHIPGVQITGDYAAAYKCAIGKLKEQGHKKIAFFCGSTDPSNISLRANQQYVQLYTQAMIEHDLAEYIMIRKGTERKDFDNAIKQLLNAPDRPTAIFADIDHRGIRLIERAKELKIKVPEDLSIIGFYGTPWSEHFDLSTFRFRFSEMASAVTNALKNNASSNDRILIPIDYINKKTVTKVPN
jgi:GntR family transcriptional regulator, arabinose operon transcriptional repressor